ITFEMLPVVSAIPLQMNQLFYNLISNALKFSSVTISPAINITAHELTQAQIDGYPTLNPSLPYFEIIIKDNGIGFEQKYEQQIFTIFQRLHNNDVYIGTGIGLAISKKIIENHSGEIFAKAKKNKGAAFHIILPLHQLS
ncbi:MAG TPA: ATP-binding protein, partial [Flavobacterium sp.]|nr:ATP-binding protein [Flavobacterium sp.]